MMNVGAVGIYYLWDEMSGGALAVCCVCAALLLDMATPTAPAQRMSGTSTGRLLFRGTTSVSYTHLTLPTKA